jgi:hypothetical protein
VLVTNKEGSFKRDLCLPNPSKTFDGGALAVILFYAGGNSREKLLQN